MNEPLLDDRYRLIAPLAEGGMSVVWHGHDEVLARSVAVKVIKTEAGPSTKFVQRVRREATALARLSHRHIANVYDYGESDVGGVRAPYLVMELVDGESLGAMLRRGPITWPTAVGIAAQVAGALAAAHAAGVVHCDVTPGNVMLCADGVKIIDFGIASYAGDIAEGVVFGTPAYLAPERRNGGRAIPASDVFGIGLLLYEMLAGRLPWPDGTATEVVAAHRTIPPAPLPVIPGLPEPVAALCTACLDVDPSRRPVSRELWLCLNGIVRAADPRSRKVLSEVTAKIGSPATAKSPIAAAVAPGSTGTLVPSAAFASGLPVSSGGPIGSVAPLGSGIPIGSGAPLGSGAALGSGTHIGIIMAPAFEPGASATDIALSPDAAAPHALGSAQAGRSRSGTRIMPHGVTALPDPGRATEPIDEPPRSWRRRSRRPFFALPSLLLLVLVICLGLSKLGANNGAAAAPVPKIQPTQPGRIAVPPSASPSATPSATPTGDTTSASNGAGDGGGRHKGNGHGKADGDSKADGHSKADGRSKADAQSRPNRDGKPGHGKAKGDGKSAYGRSSATTAAEQAGQGTIAVPETGALACQVDYQIVTQWFTGFSAQMTVTNAGQVEISGWNLQFQLAGDEHVGGGWNGVWEQDGSEVFVRNAGFNEAVPPGGTVTLGYVGVQDDGGASVPSDFTLNGTACDG